MVKVESVLRRIVLVHGAAHGAWCWEQLVPLLASRGYDVEVPDLPGLGDDPSSVKEVTLQSYIDRVVEVVFAQPEPVLLLGHSLGGGPISGAGETMPERIGRLVYLTAFLPKDSESLLSMIEIASRFPEPSVAREIRPPVDGAYEFPPDVARQMFYNACPPDVADRAVARLRPQAEGPLPGPLHLSPTPSVSMPKPHLLYTQPPSLPSPPL